MHKPKVLGVGLQYNPEILSWCPFEDLDVDFFEILLDNIMAPMDGPQIIKPSSRTLIKRLKEKFTLIGHSNYGCDFGFSKLEETPAYKSHIKLAKFIDSPWVANHCFYGDNSWLDSWSSPIQFSKAELNRCAERARKLQEYYGVPLAHENAAYYMACPGAEMKEAEFMALFVEKSKTFLHLDLHNIYANSLNFKDYELDEYLNTIPLEKVIAVHLAGGSWHDGLYHDWHDSKIPTRVWELYEELLSRATPSGVTLEYQGQAHHPDTRVLNEKDVSMVVEDLNKAKKIWRKYVGKR